MNFRSLAHNALPTALSVLILLTLNTIVFTWTFLSYKNDLKYYYLHQMLGVSLCISRATANLICFNLVFVIVSMCKAFIHSVRESITHLLPGTFRRLLDSNISLHVYTAYLICILSVIHTIAHLVNNYRFMIKFSTKFPELNIAKTKEDVSCFSLLLTLPGLTGLLLLIILMLMLISSAPIVRRDRYGMFWYTHHLAIPFTVLLLIHSYGERIESNKICLEDAFFEDEPAQVWKWLLVPVLIFIVDRMVRTWRSSQPVELQKAKVHENRIVELVIKKRQFDISPGQYVLLKCNNISNYEWHPFTPSQCPSDFSDPESFSVHMKVVGNWTDKLSREVHLRAEQGDSQANRFLNQIHVDGPFASPCKDIANFRVSICIAAGIGITPFAAVLNSLRYPTNYSKLCRIYMVWTSRELGGFHCFLKSFYDLHKELNEANRPDCLVTRFFYTGCVKELDQENVTQSAETEYFRSRLCIGRPRLPTLLNDFVRKHKRERIGVFFCGPRKISITLAELCNKINVGENTLIYHHDSF